ncbi:chemotaxis response regulator protein-glutamate methylesterase [Thiomicrorhabdus hydrogeniphila]
MITPIKVLIVDDSALVRKMLQEMLSTDPMITVVGTAFDPFDAREKIKQLRPDVLTLDVEMPKMDGVTFLKNLMRLHPVPVVMVSTLTEKGADVTFEAMDLGAVDFVTKPKFDLVNTFEDYTLEICSKVKTASRVRRSMLEQQYARYVARQTQKPAVATLNTPSRSSITSQAKATAVVKSNGRHSTKIVALGASTGGTEAIKEVLSRLPANAPAILITQHIPAAFSLPFAKRMDSISEMTVHHAEDGLEIHPGHVYIAPGDKHLVIAKSGAGLICRLDDSDPVNRHKPAVDVMFKSVLQNIGANRAIGVLLTGMGADGAVGLKALKDSGVPTIAQNEKTSVVWGMPGEAVKIGAAVDVLPLDKVAARIMELA